MSDTTSAFIRLLGDDRRYTADAYQFVREALSFGQEVPTADDDPSANSAELDMRPEHHLTGQQLCESARRYALDQYGYMAKTVLNSWGVQSTSDFGEIVYNLIRIEEMRKSESDDRQDFDDVYDFKLAFRDQYSFDLSDGD